MIIAKQMRALFPVFLVRRFSFVLILFLAVGKGKAQVQIDKNIKSSKESTSDPADSLAELNDIKIFFFSHGNIGLVMILYMPLVVSRMMAGIHYPVETRLI